MDPIIKYSCQAKKPDNLPNDFKVINDRDIPLPKEGNIYRWHLVNMTPDMDKEKVILAFKVAMAEWQRALDLIPPMGHYLLLEHTEDIEKADFIFSFGDVFHKMHGGEIDCPFAFDGVQGVLAHAFSLDTVAPFGGQMHMDEHETWADMHSLNKVHLITVVLHEVGHIFGIDHSEKKDAVMHASYTKAKPELTQDDIDGLAAKMSKVKAQFAPPEKPSIAANTVPEGGCLVALFPFLNWFI